MTEVKASFISRWRGDADKDKFTILALGDVDMAELGVSLCHVRLVRYRDTGRIIAIPSSAKAGNDKGYTTSWDTFGPFAVDILDAMKQTYDRLGDDLCALEWPKQGTASPIAGASPGSAL